MNSPGTNPPSRPLPAGNPDLARRIQALLDFEETLKVFDESNEYEKGICIISGTDAELVLKYKQQSGIPGPALEELQAIARRFLKSLNANQGNVLESGKEVHVYFASDLNGVRESFERCAESRQRVFALKQEQAKIQQRLPKRNKDVESVPPSMDSFAHRLAIWIQEKLSGQDYKDATKPRVPRNLSESAAVNESDLATERQQLKNALRFLHERMRTKLVGNHLVMTAGSANQSIWAMLQQHRRVLTKEALETLQSTAFDLLCPTPPSSDQSANYRHQTAALTLVAERGVNKAKEGPSELLSGDTQLALRNAARENAANAEIWACLGGITEGVAVPFGENGL